MRLNIKITLSLAGVIALFVGVSYFSNKYIDPLSIYIDENWYLGMVIYVVIGILGIVITPISLVPFIPIASRIYEGFLTAILSIIAWLIGSLVAFWISRRFGKKVIKYFVPLSQFAEIEEALPKRFGFWTLVLLRSTMPVEILSYVLGLFPGVTYRRFILTTIIGITPFTFVLSYLGVLPIKYQIPLFIIGLFILQYILKIFYKKSRI